MPFPFDDGSGSSYVILRPPLAARIAPLVVAVFYLCFPLFMHLAMSRGMTMSCQRSVPAPPTAEAPTAASDLRCTVEVRSPLKTTSTTVIASGAVSARERVRRSGKSSRKWVELMLPGGKAVELTEHFDGGTSLHLAELATQLTAFLSTPTTLFNFSQPMVVALPVWILAGVMLPLALLMFSLSRREAAVRVESSDNTVEVWWSFGFWTKRSTVVPRDELADIAVVPGYRGSRMLVFTRKEGRPVRIGATSGTQANADAVRALVFNQSSPTI